MRYEEIGEYAAPPHVAPAPLGQRYVSWEQLHNRSGGEQRTLDHLTLVPAIEAQE